MICAKCGARLLDTDQFCSRCGTKVIKEKRCPDCGAVLREGTKFCHKCGRLIEASEKAQQVPEETLDIPIEAIERNILSETEKKIRAEQGAVRMKPSAGAQESRMKENEGQEKPRPSQNSPGQEKSRPSQSATGQSRSTASQGSSGQEKSRSSQSATGHAKSRASQEGTVRRSPEPPKKKKAVPEPPRKKRPVYREEDDWEDEDWEEDDWNDDDWDEDDEEESVDVITIMTAVIGCVLLVVVAILGYHLYQQYVPKNYDKVQEEEQQEQAQDSGQEEAEPSADGDNAVYTLTIVDNVNVRDNPSTSGTNILKVAKAGETYECYGSAGDGSWYEIRLEDGSTGYVFQDYVTVQ